MAKLSSTLLALGVIAVSASQAQQTAPVSPAGPLVVPAAPIPPIIPAAPAPIDPPISTSAEVTPQLTAPAVSPDGTSAGPVIAPNTAHTHDFQGEEIGNVLRSLARQAGVTMIVSDKVTQAQPPSVVTARIENKTPREAIEIIVESKGLVMDDKKGVITVKTTEEKQAEPSVSGNYTLSYGQAKDIVALLTKQLVSKSVPDFDPRTNTVYFRETQSNMPNIMEFLLLIDRPTRQVMIEARLVEVNANPTQAYGINWGGVLGSYNNPQTFRYGGSNPAEAPTYVLDSNGVPQLTPGKPAAGIINETTGQLSSRDFFVNGDFGKGFGSVLGGQFAILSIPQLALTLSLLNEDADAEFLANPRIVTANNLKAKIQITRNQPVPQLNFNEQTAQAVFSGFQDKEYGNTLEVTPVINKDDFVTLSVKPEISNKVADQSFTFNGATVTSPVIDKRTLDSNVLIKSGDTLAIGGLLQDEVRKNRAKVPVLGDIPLIGYAFQEKRNLRIKRNLLIFVTPTIIKQGYGTGLEDQVSGIHHSGEEFADPNGWRNNARGAYRMVPTSNRQVAADIAKPGVAASPASKSKRGRSAVKLSNDVPVE